MKTRFGFLLLLATIGILTAQGQQASAPPPPKVVQNPFLRALENGQWWVSLTEDTKETFTDGYATAMSRVKNITHAACMDEGKNAKTGSQFNTEMSAAMNLCLLAEFFDFDVDRRNLIGGVNEFYKDPRNVSIPVDFAFEHVRDKLKGKMSAQELDDRLTGWRRTMSR